MSASQLEDRSRLTVSNSRLSNSYESMLLPRGGGLTVPLAHATAVGKVDLLSRLMDAGANGSAEESDSASGHIITKAACKILASQRKDRSRLDGFELEIFKLVRKGATSEQWSEWLRVPLEYAAVDSNEDLFDGLMDAGADGSAGWRDCHGRTLLGAAAAGKSEKITLALLQAGAKDDVDVKFGKFEVKSALHVAAANGAKEVSKALMLAGADPNVVGWADQTPLHLAAREGHDVIVSDLLENGADPNAKAIDRSTPLHVAAKKGRVLCVSKLLLGGADKNSRNDEGETPLYVAAQYSQDGVVEELLGARADLDIRDNDKGIRPLDVAAMSGSLDVLRALLRHGADVKACDDNGYTALHHAGANFWKPELDTSDAVRVLLEAGADVEAKADHGYTALHVFTCRQCSPIGTIRALLAGGANVNARIADGRTPLHLACDRSNADGVELLLRWGADERLVRQDGKTAADEVGKWNVEGDIDLEENSNGEEDTGGEEEDVDGEEEDNAADGVGLWGDDRDGERDIDDEEKRKADDLRIRHMLARAPADRSWRRRGWLALARSHPERVQLANDSSCVSSGGSSAKVAKARCDGSGCEAGDGEQAMVELGILVRRVVDLDAEGVFRSVVGFL